MDSFSIKMLGDDAEHLTRHGAGERVFEQCLYPGQQLVLSPCERRRWLKVIVGDYFEDKEAHALGDTAGIDSGLIVNQLTLKPGSAVTLNAAGGVRLQHNQPESGQGLILPVVLVSTVDERQHSRVHG